MSPFFGIGLCAGAAILCVFNAWAWRSDDQANSLTFVVLSNVWLAAALVMGVLA